MCVDSYAFVIPTFRRPRELARLLKSISLCEPAPQEVIVVNNDLAECEISYELGMGNIRVVELAAGINQAKARNVGWRMAEADAVFFVDDDNEVDSHAAWELMQLMKYGSVAIACPVILVNDSNIVWCAGIRRSRWGGRTEFIRRGTSYDVDRQEGEHEWHTDEMPDAFMIRRSALELVDGFDEERFPMYFDEADIAVRLRQVGYRCMGTDKAIVRHYNDVGNDLGVDLARVLAIHGERRIVVLARSRFMFQRVCMSKSRKVIADLVVNPAWFCYLLYRVFATEMAISERKRIIVSVMKGWFEARR